MKLPEAKSMATSWGLSTVNAWAELQTKASKMEGAAGHNDAFSQMLTSLRNMAISGRFEALPGLLKRRLTARALSWFWLSGDRYAERLLSPQLLSALLHAQQPRLTRITLQQLVQLYFRQFDLLDQHDGFRAMLELALLSQLEQLPEPRIATLRPNPLISLKQEGHKLLGLDGPRQLAEQTLQAGRELGVTFSELGLQGLDDGRYGDICRAHFYLETLRTLSLDEWSPVMDELLKPSVSKAPFEGDRCIGHAALEILIDRTGQEPSDAWQTFILNLAGDPRISSAATNYRQWWQPLGEARIQKVRGWLSKEDLRLFLQAVEQYGIQSHNDELQRMFPARKLFLEGLFKLKLIRNTRLLLGNRAQQIVKGILGKEVKTSFAPMDGAMSDKAVIYLDCGDFYLIEGSHSFKIWVYLAPPSDILTTYEKRIFSHAALTSTIPAGYQKRYGNLPLASIVHTPHTWQHKVFTFLADNGIGLDMEQLLSRQDYQYQLRRFGIPAVNPKRTPVPTPSQPTTKSVVDAITHQSALTNLSPSPVGQAREASHQAKLYEEPQQLPANASRAVNKLSAEQLSKLNGRFKYKNKPTPATPHSDEITSSNAVVAPSLSELCPRVSKLKPLELKVLQYFASNAGDRARHGANVLGMTVQEINQQLYGPLGTLCWQNSQYGWHLTSVAAAELTAYEEHHKGH
ncbi:TPA: EH signature domain-containing protein [Aeromonas salmonicida subsp. pectinolytica]